MSTPMVAAICCGLFSGFSYLVGFYVGRLAGYRDAMKANAWHRTENGWYKETP